MTKVTHPHAAVTICNALWGSHLSFSPFSAGDQRVEFSSFFPEEQALVETFQEAGLDPLELCKLLLASHSYRVSLLGELALPLQHYPLPPTPYPLRC